MNVTRRITVAILLLALVSSFVFAQSARPALRTFRVHNYEVLSDLPLPDARPVALHMDATFEEYERLFSGFGTRNAKPTRLYIFGTRDAYLVELERQGLNADNTAGVFFHDNQTAGLATFVEDQSGPEMYHVLQHEGFHQFAHLRIGDALPVWSNEGLAEYFGQAIMVRGVLRTGMAPASRIESIRRQIQENKTFPITELFAMSSKEWGDRVTRGDERAGLMYDQSWSIVHFLIHADNGRRSAALNTYVKCASTGLQPDQMIAKAFGSADALAILERDWKAWALEQWKPDPVSTATERLEFMGQGIIALAKQDVPISSVDDMRTKLRERKFRMRKYAHGVLRVMSASDESLFAAPEAEKPQQKVRMELTPPTKGAPVRLPGILVSGLSTKVRLTWGGTAEEPRVEIVYE